MLMDYAKYLELDGRPRATQEWWRCRGDLAATLLHPISIFLLDGGVRVSTLSTREAGISFL